MKKILVVDDDVDALTVLDLVLTHHNFIVKTTRKWQSVSKDIESFKPDLILLDIDLGGADGGDIFKKLKQSKETQQVPVILCSVIMPEDYLTACNAQGFLNKPLETSNLLEIIRHSLN